MWFYIPCQLMSRPIIMQPSLGLIGFYLLYRHTNTSCLSTLLGTRYANSCHQLSVIWIGTRYANSCIQWTLSYNAFCSKSLISLPSCIIIILSLWASLFLTWSLCLPHIYYTYCKHYLYYPLVILSTISGTLLHNTVIF